MDAVLSRAAVDRYERPSELVEAYRLLQESGDAGRVVGGGTDLALHLPAGVTMLIDLTRLPLSHIEQRDGRVAVGATTTLATIARDPTLADLAGGLLASVLGQLGSQALRNIATLGGHLARGRLSDLVPALLVLDAEVVLFDGDEHIVPLAELYDAGWCNRPMVITEVRLAALERPPVTGFIRFSRTTFDFAILNCAVALHLAADGIESARVAVGETPALARRVTDVEQFLAGRRLDAGTITGAADLAREHVTTGDDQRASAEYRRHLVGIGVRRALRMAAGAPEVEP
ncbi:MAG: xanthine dehydrogenase family protein subunit M [Acidimicrobiia bacterium]